jgi:hypothetical protein
MKHMFLKSATALFLSVTILVFSCQKGDAGPAGEKGDKGDKGDAGAAGATGTAGKPGTANVIYSDWIDVTFGRIDTVSTNVRYGGIIDAPKLVDSILRKGEVKVYWNLNTAADPAIVSLPYVNNRAIVPNLGNLYINPLYVAGQILLYANLPVSSGEDADGKYWQYRYVIIPGGVSARSAVNWNDYASVKKYLGLKD